MVTIDKDTDDVDNMIDEYISLAKLAKKYLAVPASSAAVERVFSISGHIFSVKRRRLGIKYFTDLVYLKLNELFMYIYIYLNIF